MNRIDQLFSKKKNNILSVYFTAGYPHLEDTVSILQALQKHGIDLVEIGVPFSDPIADGPVIQQSNHIALQNGMSIHTLFEQLKHIRSHIDIPLVLMGYLNPIMQYGFENFCKACAAVGIDGIIVPDLPLAAYIQDYKVIVEKYALNFISLITPETSEERIYEIDKHTGGFIYMVSSASVTGVQQSFESRLSYFNRIRNMNLKNARLIGFGVSNKTTLKMVNEHASGAIIGSLFINTLTKTTNIELAVTKMLDDLKN
jgi:tryptophan synthase alpha chain